MRCNRKSALLLGASMSACTFGVNLEGFFGGFTVIDTDSGSANRDAANEKTELDSGKTEPLVDAAPVDAAAEASRPDAAKDGPDRWCDRSTHMFCDDFDVVPLGRGWGSPVTPLASPFIGSPGADMMLASSAPRSFRTTVVNPGFYYRKSEGIYIERAAGPAHRVILDFDLNFQEGSGPYSFADVSNLGDVPLNPNDGNRFLNDQGFGATLGTPTNGWHHVRLDVTFGVADASTVMIFDGQSRETGQVNTTGPVTQIRIFLGMKSPGYSNGGSANFDNVTIDWL
jgi:hypothetical protein